MLENFVFKDMAGQTNRFHVSVKGETLITAAFDTTEEELDDLFRNLNEKDPRRLLRNLDLQKIYCTLARLGTTLDNPSLFICPPNFVLGNHG